MKRNQLINKIRETRFYVVVDLTLYIGIATNGSSPSKQSLGLASVIYKESSSSQSVPTILRFPDNLLFRSYNCNEYFNFHQLSYVVLL